MSVVGFVSVVLYLSIYFPPINGMYVYDVTDLFVMPIFSFVYFCRGVLMVVH